MINDKKILQFIDEDKVDIQEILLQRLQRLFEYIQIAESEKDKYLQSHKEELLHQLKSISNEVDNSYKHIIINLLLQNLSNKY